MKKISLFFFAILLAPMVMAEGNDIIVHGFEADKLLNLGSAIFATTLFVLTIVAYGRSRNKRLLFVSLAFMLFAIKGVLLSLELIYGDLGWTDVATSLMDFGILLTFFLGIIKK